MRLRTLAAPSASISARRARTLSLNTAANSLRADFRSLSWEYPLLGNSSRVNRPVAGVTCFQESAFQQNPTAPAFGKTSLNPWLNIPANSLNRLMFVVFDVLAMFLYAWGVSSAGLGAQ